MKQIYFALFLISTLFAQSQIVNIPDANFKNALLDNFPVIDTNNDGEISISEAQTITYLGIAFDDIQDLTGIEAFINLVNLDCRFNQLTSLDLSYNTELFELSCGNNQLTTLNLGTNTNLTRLRTSSNELTSLDISSAVSLRHLYVNENHLSSLDISSNAALEDFHASGNNLTSVNLNGANALQSVILSSNQLTNLDLSNRNDLVTLHCNFNQLTNLNISGATQLYNLYFNSNPIVDIDLSDNINLNNLDCRDTQLVTLDISNSSYLGVLRASNNPNLNYINLKNGGNDNLYIGNFDQLNSLEVVCIDSINSDFAMSFQEDVGEDVFLTEFCSFTPGGAYYEVNGNAILDLNNDGCDATDITYPNLSLQISDGTVTGTFYSTNLGEYNMPLQAGSYTVSPQLENPDYFSLSPTTLFVEFPMNLSPMIQDFCITPNGNKNDLEITIIPVDEARPGFDTAYKIIYKNKGNTTLSGSIDFMFDDDHMNILSVSPAPNSQIVDNVIWNYSNLLPFETRELNLIMTLNTPTDPNFPLNGDDVISFHATIYPIETDETPDDNTITLNQEVVNAFDPNDKTCLEGSVISPDQVGKYVHYLIRFENTGSASAINVVIKDNIDTTKYDLSSLIPLDSSHDFYTRIRNDSEVVFIFENIQLPFDDANNDGYILFKIRTLPSLMLGESFSNEAEIYFDYNAPIITNNETTTIQNNLSIYDFSLNSTIKLYPNPIRDYFNIENINSLNVITIELYDTSGKKLKQFSESSHYDIQNLVSGLYFIKIKTNKSEFIKKVIKI